MSCSSLTTNISRVKIQMNQLNIKPLRISCTEWAWQICETSWTISKYTV